MTQSQAERYAAAQLKLFPDAKTEVYCLSDQELVNGAMRWPEMTESMEAVLCK
jgi:transposase